MMNIEDLENKLLNYKQQGCSLSLIYNEVAHMGYTLKEYIKEAGNIQWLTKDMEQLALSGAPFWICVRTDEKTNTIQSILGTLELEELFSHLGFEDNHLSKAISHICTYSLSPNARASICYHTASYHIAQRDMKMMGLSKNEQYWTMSIEDEMNGNKEDEAISYEMSVSDMFEAREINLENIALKYRLENELVIQKNTQYRPKI